MVATLGTVPAFVAVKTGIGPEPLAARPTVVLEFVQLYTVPNTAPVKDTAVVDAPLHNDWLATAFTVGTGFTITPVTEEAGEEHPSSVTISV